MTPRHSSLAFLVLASCGLRGRCRHPGVHIGRSLHYGASSHRHVNSLVRAHLGRGMREGSARMAINGNTRACADQLARMGRQRCFAFAFTTHARRRIPLVLFGDLQLQEAMKVLTANGTFGWAISRSVGMLVQQRLGALPAQTHVPARDHHSVAR
jgi:hypothetical protein